MKDYMAIAMTRTDTNTKKGETNMFVKMVGLYGLDDSHISYYRKQGRYCFDFVFDIEYASPLTEEECDKILDGADWYCKQYNANRLEVVKGE